MCSFENGKPKVSTHLSCPIVYRHNECPPSMLEGSNPSMQPGSDIVDVTLR